MFKLRRLTRVWVVVVLVVCAVFLAGANPEVGEARSLLATSPSLGTAAPFAILAGTPNITNVPTSSVFGNVGLSPATGAGIGLTCVEVTGTIYSVDTTGPLPCRVTNAALLTTAKTDLGTAYDNLSAGANATCTVDYGAVTKELASLTLVPGVYCANAFQLSGTLTLDDSGGAAGVWIFRSVLSTLNTSAGVGARVLFSTGVASTCNVWWKVASSATIGSGTAFMGNILALTSIGLGSGASLNGRALARNGAVTLNNNLVNASACVGDTLPPTVGVTKGFSPTTINAGGISLLTITFGNTGSSAATLTSSFTDNLPSGMVIANPSNVATTCGGSGALTAIPGSSTVTMAAGRTIPANGNCALTVNVTTASAVSCANMVNTIPIGALVTTNGNNTTPASATLICNAAPIQPAEVPEADTLLLFGGGIGGLATWLGWQWRKARARSKQ